MTNWFDVPQSEEPQFIESLRTQAFPKASEKHWVALNEMFSYLIDGYEEIPFQQGFYIGVKHQVELIEMVDAFGNSLISIDVHKVVRLRRLYKFFATKSFSALRAAQDYFNELRSLKMDNPNFYYTAKELMIKLRKPNHAPFIYLPQYLLDVELISPSSRQAEPTADNSESVKYALGVEVIYNFENWYQRKYLPLFGSIFSNKKNIENDGPVYGEKWKVVKLNEGKGGQSSVHIVKDLEKPDDDQYALKLLNNYQRNDRFITEIEACKKLNHPNVIKLVDHSALDQNVDSEKRYLVMEYQAGGNLKERVNLYKGQLDSTIVVAKYLAEALKYSHSMGVIHRDVKPQNILFKRNGDHDCLISDFGICLIVGHERHSLEDEVVGPRFFMAPELEAGGQLNVRPAADVYSLGKVIFYMISGGVILTREQHRDPQYGVFKEGGRHKLLGILLDEMICQESTRIKTMDIVIRKLEEIEDWEKQKDLGPDEELKNLYQDILGGAQEKSNKKQQEMEVALQRQKNYENFLSSFKDWFPYLVDQKIEPLNNPKLIEIKKAHSLLPGNLSIGAVNAPNGFYVNAYEYGFSFTNLQEGPFNPHYLIFSILQPHSLGSNRFTGTDANFIFVPIYFQAQNFWGFLNKPGHFVASNSPHITREKVGIVSKSFFGGNISLRLEGKISEWPSNAKKFEEIVTEAIKLFLQFTKGNNRFIAN